MKRSLVLLMCVVGLIATPAATHTVWQGGNVWESPDFTRCLKGYSESREYDKNDVQNRPHGFGQIKALKEIRTQEGDIYCAAGWVQAYRRLTIRLDTLKLVNGEWTVCWGKGKWWYNETTRYELSLSHNWSAGPCGPGYYATLVTGGLWNDQLQRYLGGSVFSGKHYFR